MATAASSSAAILSTMKHVTTNKWEKATARLDEIGAVVREAEANLTYTEDSPDGRKALEDDVSMLLGVVRKTFTGSLNTQVNSRGGHRVRGGTLRRDASTFNSVYISLERRLHSIERMLSNAKYSSGLSKSAALAWRDELLGYLRQGQHRMDYTMLFGKLTNEWTEFRSNELAESIESGKEQKEKIKIADDDSTVAVGRKEMYEQRQTWEKVVTTLRTTDEDKITTFLDDLFHAGPRYEKETSVDEADDLRTTLLMEMRRTISDRCKQPIQITAKTVKTAIQNVLQDDQLTSEKRRAMLDLSNRANVLSEIADILNIDLKLASIDRWSWGEKPITTQMRKAINGKYRVYMDIELLDSILIQCVGQFMSVNISEALTGAWNCDVADVWTGNDNESRTAAIRSQIPSFAEQRTVHNSVNTARNQIYQGIFYSPRLPREMEDGSRTGGYDDDKSTVSDNRTGPALTDLFCGRPSVFSLKTDILRVCAAEMNLQKLIHGQFCILQSDFEWFGPSLPHSTLIAIMNYFHFPKEMVHFMQAFLNMNVKFEEDGKNGEVLTRKTGIPVSFQITDGVAELLLFILDFAVNQKTGGAHLYRNHDDLWFWGQPEQCAVAWKTICDFTTVMGLQLNKEKTAFAHSTDEGNVRFKAATKTDLNQLPTGQVKWGFLVFDEKDWKWVANRSGIEEHMDELRFQLKSRTSVMAHIQAYNAYIKNFLPNNFGSVVVGLGDDHPVTVLEALQHAQRHLYRGGGDGVEEKAGSVAEHIRTTIHKRFGGPEAYEVPDCFLYLNIEHGGLGLADPAPSFAQYIQLPKEDADPDENLPPLKQALKKMHAQISADYRKHAKEFTTKMNNRLHKQKLAREQALTSAVLDDSEDNASDASSEYGAHAVPAKQDGVPQFMSFSAYLGTTAEHSEPMAALYRTLLNEPWRSNEEVTGKNWAAEMLDGELEELFGGFIAEEEFLSLGLYRTLAEEKVRWTG